MKRAFALLMIIGLFGASVATAEAGKGKKKPTRIERAAESVYDAPALGTATTGGGCPNATNSCAPMATGKNDKFVKVSIADATGTAVAFMLGQDTDPTTVETDVIYGVFCGTTGDSAIALEAPGVELLTFVWAFGDIRCPGAVATTGTVTAVFSNLP